jgi:S-methylmethionine-dependent homocysteine/selenocysteine methylase
MPDTWLQKLETRQVVLLDGGTGSELRRRGARLDDTAWSGLAAREHPALLRDIHRDYIDAGADVITANTFAGARFLFEAAGAGARWADTNRRAVEIARSVRDGLAPGRVGVAGSMSNLPPRFDTGAYPAPAGELADYQALAALIADAGADLIVLEMIQDVAHGARALEAAAATGLPVWLGMSVRRHPRHGGLVGFDLEQQRFEHVLVELLAWRPAVVNVMHSTLDAVEPAIDVVRRHWHGPIGVYPELPAISAAEFVAQALRWAHAGVRVIGGCCGSTPAHIAALREARAALQVAWDAGNRT